MNAAGKPVPVACISFRCGNRGTELTSALTDREGRFATSVTFPRVSGHALRAHYLGRQGTSRAVSDTVDIDVQAPPIKSSLYVR